MKRSLLTLACVGLAACGGQQTLNASDERMAEPAKPTEACDVYESSKWRAWLDKSGHNNDLILKVSGEVTLPSPGHTVEWHTGPMDRMQPPGLRLRLITLAPPSGQMNIQMLSEQRVTFKMTSPVPEYRSVKVLCGDQVLVNMKDVMLTD